MPIEQTDWRFEGETETGFTQEYDAGRERLLWLYDKGKQLQWDAAERIDWSLDVDPRIQWSLTIASSQSSISLVGEVDRQGES